MPDFFDEVDSIGVVEQHLEQVLGLEESEAKKLLRRYKEIRQELRDRLDRLPGDTFSAQQLRGVLTQVESAIYAMTNDLKSGLQSSGFSMAEQGVEHLLSELSRFDRHFRGAVVPIDVNTQLIMQETSNFLLNKYEASLDAYGADLISQMTTTLTTEALAQSSLSSVVKRLGAFFQGEEWKLQRIARTELHNAYGLGKLKGMEEVVEGPLPDLMKTLYHPMDSRTGADSIYADRRKLIVPVSEPFKYLWKGKLRVFMAPPDRPNDRAILIPYRQEWEQ